MKIQKLVMILGGTLAACTQTPAPVYSGYKRMVEVEQQPQVAAAEAPRSPGVNTKAFIPSFESATAVRAEEIEPAAGPVAKPQAARAPQPKVEMVQHTAKATDTVYSLARQYDTSVREILQQNNLKATSDIREGQVLTIASHSKPSVSAWDQMKEMLAETPAPVQPKAAVRGAESAMAKPEVAEAPAAPQKNAPVLAQEQKLAAIEPAAGRAPQKDGVVLVDHQVVAGETIYRISRTYDASVLDIMSANAFDQPQDLKAGTVVKVPVNQKVAVKNTADDGVVVREKNGPEISTNKTEEKIAEASVKSEEKITAVEEQAAAEKTVAKSEQIAGQSSEDNETKVAQDTADKPTTAADEIKAELKRGQVDPVAARASGPVWPVKGTILRRFGEEGNGIAHTGINIAVPPGTPVLATDDGSILYADEGLKTYGKLVLIRHANGMVSAYAHNGHLLVRKGEKVKKGQIIATSGSSGNVDTPQLHFELRRHASALDPLRELPKL